MASIFGSYVHYKPTGVPFYVGKGTRKRMKDFYTTRSDWHKHITAKYGRKNILFSFIECSSEEIAFELEKGLIKTFKNSDYSLCNLSDGGNGPIGYKPTPETIAKIAAKNRGRVQSAEERAKRSMLSKGTKKPPFSEEHKKKLGLLAKGKRWYNNGKNIVFCFEGRQPSGYVHGRKNRKLVKEKV